MSGNDTIETVDTLQSYESNDIYQIKECKKEIAEEALSTNYTFNNIPIDNNTSKKRHYNTDIDDDTTKKIKTDETILSNEYSIIDKIDRDIDKNSDENESENENEIENESVDHENGSDINESASNDEINDNNDNQDDNTNKSNGKYFIPSYRPKMVGDIVLIDLPFNQVGIIIGPKGKMIQELKRRTNAKIFVDQDFPEGENRKIQISGSQNQIKSACELINDVLLNGTKALKEWDRKSSKKNNRTKDNHNTVDNSTSNKNISAEIPIHYPTNSNISNGLQVHSTIECPKQQASKLISPSTNYLHEINQRTGAIVNIDSKYPDGLPYKISLSGSQQQVTSAMQLLTYIMEKGTLAQYGPLPTQIVLPQTIYQQQQQLKPQQRQFDTMKTIEVPKSFVGKILGKKGETVISIGKRSGCKLQVDQNVPEGFPCKINISGPPLAIPIAEQLVQEIINGQPNNNITIPTNTNTPVSYMNSFNMPMTLPSQIPIQTTSYFNPQQMMLQYQLNQQNQINLQQQFNQSSFNYMNHQMFNGMNPVSSPWTEYKTESGQKYWYNTTTGVSQWEPPRI